MKFKILILTFVGEIMLIQKKKKELSRFRTLGGDRFRDLIIYIFLISNEFFSRSKLEKFQEQKVAELNLILAYQIPEY